MKNDQPTSIKLVEEYITDFFNFYHVENAANLARLAISEVTGMSYAKSVVKKPMLTLQECDAIDEICDRVAAGEPIQYVVGHAPFRFLDLTVNPNVLIPRPETEMMVDIVAFYLKKNGITQPLIADVGTGSGALAVSFATEIKDCTVYATDVSSAALNVARENAQKYKVSDKIYFEHCSCLDNFEYFQHSRNHFSAIVSNPPYIPSEIVKKLPNRIRDFEPEIALDGGEDGLDVFREIVLGSKLLLEEGGLLLFELHETCLEEAKQFAESQGLRKVTIMKDLAGKNRFLASIG